MVFARTAAAALLLGFPHVTVAQVAGERAASGCVSLGAPQSRVSATGRLTLRRFAGAPNHRSIAAGDAPERTFILELPSSACIDDGGDFANPSERFATVHVSARDPALLRALRAARGRRVTVSGEGVASHTGHHRAPLVILADRVTVR